MINNTTTDMETVSSVTELLTSQPRRRVKGVNVETCLTQNAILKITLDGPSIALTILGLVAAIQVFQPSITCMLVILLPLPLIVYNDFQNFLFLGPGGTPSTFLGYLRIAYLRLFALSDTYTPARTTQDTYPQVGLHKTSTSWLPVRQGTRPIVAGIAPHRQTDQAGCIEMDAILRATLNNVAKLQPDFFTIGQSCFEKKGLALFARHPINNTCNGEICHVHHVDGSLHMNIHPGDAREVLEKKWGERHPLSKGGWLKQYVPEEFTMIYAPRDVAELRVLCHIIEAATYWVTGNETKIEIASTTTARPEGSKLV